MKKITMFILACLPLLASAQTYDTISGPNGRYYKYYYSTWIDECGVWNDTQTRPLHPDVPGSLRIYPYDDEYSFDRSGNPLEPPLSYAKPEYVSQPTAIKGVAVVTSDRFGDPWSGMFYINLVTEETLDTMVPDTCFVFNVVNGEMDVLDFSRWDTATPKIYKVPWHEDSIHAGFAYFMVYEAYFKSPIEVNDTFYIVGTPYHNKVDLYNVSYIYYPHLYAILNGQTLLDDPCLMNQQNSSALGYEVAWGGDKPTLRSSSRWSGGTPWGAFLPILSDDSVTLSTQSADTTMGHVTPQSGTVLQWVTHTLTAVPNRGYKFSHWHDGSTDNPRRVLMDQDSSFTAYFEPKEQYHIAVSVDNPEHGYVTGGGTYYELDTVRMEAFPSSDRFRFDFWGDGNVSNPRYLLARSDTSFIAFFKELTSIDTVSGNGNLFSLTPNPATGRTLLTISCPGQRHDLVVRDAAGHEVMYKVIPPVQTAVDLDLSNLPAGAYFVTLSTPASSATQRLVVK